MSLNKKRNIIYLYSEVMPYAIAVMRALVQEFDVQVDCICWDENKRTPFVPADEAGIYFHKRSAFNKTSVLQFIEERTPAIIYVVGRMDKLYLHAAANFKGRYPVVSGCDNQWLGTAKQKLATYFSYLLYRRYFDFFWVPGRRQYDFARRMGYAHGRIIPHFLTADTAVFGSIYEQHKQVKKERYPHTIVYAGRFAPTKGVDLLIQAFTEVKNEMENDWQLVLVGSGDLPYTDKPFIKVRSFMQGPQMAMESRHWGVFCLPSIYEPWGVVIHEFTMAGLPVICSDSVGADALVINNYNGFVFKSGDKGQLKNAIVEVMNKSDEELLAMGTKGHQLSEMHSPVIAAYSLMSVLQ